MDSVHKYSSTYWRDYDVNCKKTRAPPAVPKDLIHTKTKMMLNMEIAQSRLHHGMKNIVMDLKLTKSNFIQLKQNQNQMYSATKGPAVSEFHTKSRHSYIILYADVTRK